MPSPTISRLPLATLLVICVVTISGQPQYGDQYHYDSGKNYEYQYSVRDPKHHDIKDVGEAKHGDVVKGFYKLKEKDGSTREVVYTADKHSGFHAQVTKDGHQVWPPIVTKAQYAIPVHGGGAYQQLHAAPAPYQQLHAAPAPYQHLQAAPAPYHLVQAAPQYVAPQVYHQLQPEYQAIPQHVYQPVAYQQAQPGPLYHLQAAAPSYHDGSGLGQYYSH